MRTGRPKRESPGKPLMLLPAWPCAYDISTCSPPLQFLDRPRNSRHAERLYLPQDSVPERVIAMSCHSGDRQSAVIRFAVLLRPGTSRRLTERHQAGCLFASLSTPALHIDDEELSSASESSTFLSGVGRVTLLKPPISLGHVTLSVSWFLARLRAVAHELSHDIDPHQLIFRARSEASVYL